MPSLHEILVRKQLHPGIFDSNGFSIHLPIDLHIRRLYNDIYSRPYPNAVKHYRIARPTHGIQHVTRAAINIPIFANLYRRYGDIAALALNDEDIKLLQIAALFHDSGREAEGVDFWDQDSGLLFYQYATKILEIAPDTAKLLAEAIANKDANEANYFELKGMDWLKREKKSPKNIHQKLIHDADCLEIIRARDHFDANYLDFYKDIALLNDEAFEIMAKLITEARSLIASQGDSSSRRDHKIKAQYEDGDAYRKIMDFITENKERYPLIITLSNNNRLIEEKLHEPLAISLSKEASTSISEESLAKAMYAGNLFGRGVGSPSAISKYRPTDKEDEKNADIEFRKMSRVPDTPTRTKKPNKFKYGNSYRSIAMLSNGSGGYSGQGLLILNPDINYIHKVSFVNDGTGRGKKSHISGQLMTLSEKSAQLKALHRKLQMGGSSIQYDGQPLSTHNEILYTITKADAIYFTQDPTRYNYLMYGDDKPLNNYTHYLQALFLQIKYEKATGKKLPIFEYSGVHNFIKAAPIYTEDEIVAMWVEIVSDLIKKDLETKGYCSESLEALKIKAIDGYTGENNIIKKQTALDLIYSPELQIKINIALKEASTKLLLEYEQKLIERIKDGEQLFRLFERPLEELNIDQRTRIFKAIEVNLGTLIKNGHQLWSLLSLPLEQLNTDNREQIFRAVESNLGALMTNPPSSILTLPESKLSIKHKEQIKAAYENLFNVEGMHGLIDYDQTLNLLTGQPIGTYLLHPSFFILGDFILAYVNKEGKVGQAIISAVPSGNGRVIDSNNQIFRSMQTLIMTYSSPFADGRDALLKKALLPVAAKVTPDVVAAEISAPIPGRNGLFAAHNQALITPFQHKEPIKAVDKSSFDVEGTHGRIDHRQTLKLLTGQPIGTYLLRDSIYYPGNLILAFVNKEETVQQIFISSVPFGNGMVKVFGEIYPSIQSLIKEYSILKTALLPVAEKVTPDVVAAEISAPIPGRNGLFAAHNQAMITPLPQTSAELTAEVTNSSIEVSKEIIEIHQSLQAMEGRRPGRVVRK